MRKPKPIRLTLEPWTAPKAGRPYPGLVTDVSLEKQSIVVTVKNLHKRMAGRMHRAALPRDMHPGNKTSRFASAVGLEVSKVGESIDLRAAIGVTVAMRFIPAGDDYEIEFEKVKNSDRAGRGRDNPSERSEETIAGGTGHSR